EALVPHGLMLGHDPWTVGVATVGGAIGTNGLGYLGARAGSIAAQVQALEAVLADGRIVRTRPSPARSVGLDPARLLVGTEGTLGIVTEATLAVLPRPEERLVRGYRMPSFEAGVAVAARCRRTGIRIASLDVSAEDLPPAPASLLIVFDGLRGEAHLHAERALALVHAAGGEASSDAEAAEKWAARHAIAERWAASRNARAGGWLRGGQFDYAHVGVPLAALGEVRAAAHALIRRHRLGLVEEGLWHWPELYSVVVTGPADAAAGVRETVEGVLRAAQDAGGTMEYCHGVGWKLAHLMEREHGAAGLDVLRDVAHDLALARGERLGQRLIELGRPQCGRDPHVSVGDGADGVDQRLDGKALEDDAAGAGADRRQRVLRALAGRHHDHFRKRGERGDVGERVAVHLEVEQEDVARRLPEHRMEAVHPVGLGHDRDPGSEREQRPEALAEERVIVGDGHPDRHRRGDLHASGSVRRRCAPGPSRSTRIVPPASL